MIILKSGNACIVRAVWARGAGERKGSGRSISRVLQWLEERKRKIEEKSGEEGKMGEMRRVGGRGIRI